MDLARAVLKLCAGRYRYLGEEMLIPFLISLPPSTELLALIQVMNPDYIFGWNRAVDSLLPWLKAIPFVPPEFINLWEDYAYISELLKVAWQRWEERDMSLFSGQHIHSKVPELLPTLVAIVLGHVVDKPLRQIHAVLGITWEKFREIICSFWSNVARDETISRVRFVDVSFPEAHPWSTVARDLARRHIHLIKSNEAGNLPEEIDIDSLFWDLPLLVRASPPCPELYRDLWTIGSTLPPLAGHMRRMIYHVSKWLESFSDPTLELIAFWRQCILSAEKAYNVPDYSLEDSLWEEDYWRHKILRIHSLSGVFPSTECSS
ncbi:hypothetical protein K438DRAFT_540991 [Mycena galopus ATCC 62051]|nr:hypothetical protein K438DRAFT_540991 [Mycena galopus ATCC 62051]